MRRIIALLCVNLIVLCSCVSLRDSDASPENLYNAESVRITEKKLLDSLEYGAFTPSHPVESSEYRASDENMKKTEITDVYIGVDIDFAAFGDNLIHPNIYLEAKMRGNSEKEYDFLPIYSDVSDIIKNADISFINQETVMAGEEYGYSGYPCFNSPRHLGLDLCSLGVDIINIANNHMLDKGTAGLASTMEFWNEQDVLTVGAYENAEDASIIRIVSRDGIDIAVLSYTYGTNGIVKDPSSPIVIPYIDDALILSDLEKAETEADFIIVSIHWGIENTYTPTDEQRRLAALMADNGADVIIGHHSHSLQPIEWIDREDGGKTLCIYSLGNCISGMARPMNQVGGIFSFRITSDGAGGLCAADVLLTPTVFYYGMDYYGTHLYLLKDYTDDIAVTHGVGIEGYRLSRADAEEIVRGVIDEEFIPDYLKKQ